MNNEHPSGTEGIIGLIATIRDKANRLIVELLRQRGVTDIVPAHGGVFVHLFQAGEMTMGGMAGRLDRDKSTVTSLVKKLTALGYLTTRKSPEDGRVTLISLTRAGRALEDDFQAVSRELLGRVYSGFNSADKLALKDLLDRINRNLD